MSKRFVPIVVVVALVVAGVAVWLVRGVGRQMTTFTAQFEDSIGLYEGNAVSVLGMQIGTVTKITPAGDHIDVEMAIDPGVDVPADVQAVTVSTSILTDRHVELTPAYRGGPRLRNGDVVGLGRTRTPVQFDKSLAMVDKLMRSLGGDGRGRGPLADLVGVGDSVATRSGNDIKETLSQLSEALELGPDGGAQSGKNIQSIVRNVAELSQVASDNDSAIRQFGSSLHQFTDLIAAQDLGSGDTGKQVNVILDRVTRLLQANRAKIESTLGATKELSQLVVDNRDHITELFDVGPTLANNLYNAVDSDAGSIRLHVLLDKMLTNGQFTKEVCNLLQAKQLNCYTGTMADLGPDFGLGAMLDLLNSKPPQ